MSPWDLADPSRQPGCDRSLLQAGDGRRLELAAGDSVAAMAPRPAPTTSHAAKVARTVVQAVLAAAAAVPAALAVVPIPSKYNGAVALVVGIAAALVVIVSAVQNALEAKGVIRTAFARR